MTLNVICWKWKHPTYRTTYTAEHVNVLAKMFARHYQGDHRVICVTDDDVGVECETHRLWSDCSRLVNPNGLHFPSCYRRLKIFDAQTQRDLRINVGERILSIDLDVVIVGDVRPLFDRDEEFIGWRGVGALRPVVYNGSLFMFKAGSMGQLWSEFDPMRSPAAAKSAGYFGSDQGYLSHRLNGGAPGWDKPEVLSYNRDLQNSRQLPSAAKIVSFNGKLKPWDKEAKTRAPWIEKHWRCNDV